MTPIRQFLLKLKERAIAALKEAWYTEPTMVQAAVVSALVAIAAALHLAIKQGLIEVLVSVLLPLVAGAALRRVVTPVNKAKAVALAKLGSHRHVVGVFLFHRTALVGRARIERLQAAALAEEHEPEDTEPAREALRARYTGEVTATSKLAIKHATHKERGRWVILASS